MGTYPSGWNKTPSPHNHEKRSFSEGKNYYEVMELAGVPITDFDANEKAEIAKHQMRRTLQDLFGDFFSEDAFKISEHTPNTNDFKISGGIGNTSSIDFEFNSRGYIQSMPVVLTGDTTYKTQPIAQSAITPPTVGSRTDYVYLDVYLVEKDGSDDLDIIFDGTSSSLTTRLKMQWEIKVSVGELPIERYIGAGDIPHHCILLAKIVRNTTDEITDAMITDLRPTTNSCASVESSASEMFTLQNNDTLNIDINGESISLTFVTGDFLNISSISAIEMAKVLGKKLHNLCNVFVSNSGKITIKTRKHGEGASIQVTGGTANSELLFPTDEMLGTWGTMIPKFLSKTVLSSLGVSGLTKIVGTNGSITGNFSEIDFLAGDGVSGLIATKINDGKATLEINTNGSGSGSGVPIMGIEYKVTEDLVETSGKYRLTLLDTTYQPGADNLLLFVGGQLLKKNEQYIEVDTDIVDLIDLPSPTNTITAVIGVSQDATIAKIAITDTEGTRKTDVKELVLRKAGLDLDTAIISPVVGQDGKYYLDIDPLNNKLGKVKVNDTTEYTGISQINIDENSFTVTSPSAGVISLASKTAIYNGSFIPANIALVPNSTNWEYKVPYPNNKVFNDYPMVVLDEEYHVAITSDTAAGGKNGAALGRAGVCGGAYDTSVPISAPIIKLKRRTKEYFVVTFHNLSGDNLSYISGPLQRPSAINMNGGWSRPMTFVVCGG